MSESISEVRQVPSSGRFMTTRWSLVVSAGVPDDEESKAALTSLCESYWPPLYAYVRRRGFDSHDARDLTQSFFLRLLEKNTVAAADSERGRFRTFLLTSMQNFLANELDRQNALKRGGGRHIFSMDFDSADRVLEPALADSTSDPERVFEREWAMHAMRRALDALETEYVEAGRGELFESLVPALTDAGESPRYSSIAESRRMSRDAVKMAAGRMRKRYRELIRTEVRATVADGEAIGEELTHLFQSLS